MSFVAYPRMGTSLAPQACAVYDKHIPVQTSWGRGRAGSVAIGDKRKAEDVGGLFCLEQLCKVQEGWEEDPREYWSLRGLDRMHARMA